MSKRSRRRKMIKSIFSIGIDLRKMDELLPNHSDPVEIEKIDYDATEELRKIEERKKKRIEAWPEKYKKYLRGEDYCFYEPYIGLTRFSDSQKQKLVQYRKPLLFELGKHRNKESVGIIENIVNIANSL